MKAGMSKYTWIAMAAAIICAASPALGQDAPPVPPAAPNIGDLKAALELANSAVGNMQEGSAVDESQSKPTVVTAPKDMIVATKPELDGEVITSWRIPDLPVQLVLRQLAVSSRRNIIASAQVTGNISADLFDVTIYEALEALLQVNGFDYVEQGDFIFVYTAKELEDMRKKERELITRVFHLHYLKPKDASTLVAPCLSEDSQIATTPDPGAGVKTNKEEAGGMDYAVNDVLVISDYEENLQRVALLLKEADRRPDQVLIEATIMVAQLTEENSLGINFTAIDGISLGSLDMRSSFGTGGMTAFTPGSGLTMQLLSSDVGILVEALESITDVSVLANPKLLVINRQRGEIVVGRERGYPGQFIYNEDGVRTGQEVEQMQTGTSMIVRPFIGDNGYIRMEIHPEDSSGTIDSNLLPDKSTTECTSNIMVRDGHTIIISGMFRESTSTTTTQIPVLGSLPWIGALFRETADDIAREEMIILITPRIIRQADDEMASDQLKIEAERFRLSMRNKLQWFGRNRMSVRYYNWAREMQASGHNGLATLMVNMALHNDPAMEDALVLQQQLTGQMLQDNEPRFSNVRYIIEKMMLNEMRNLHRKTGDVPVSPLGSTIYMAPDKMGAINEFGDMADADDASDTKSLLLPAVAADAGLAAADIATDAAAAAANIAADLAAKSADAASDVATAAADTAMDKSPSLADADAPSAAQPTATTEPTAPTSLPTVDAPAIADAAANVGTAQGKQWLENGFSLACAGADAFGKLISSADMSEPIEPAATDAAVAAAEAPADKLGDTAADNAVDSVEAAAADKPYASPVVTMPEMELEIRPLAEAVPDTKPIMDLPRDTAENAVADASGSETEVKADSADSGDESKPAYSTAYYIRPDSGVRPLFELPR